MSWRTMVFSSALLISAAVFFSSNVEASFDSSDGVLTFSWIDVESFTTFAQNSSESTDGSVRISGRSTRKLIGLAIAVVAGIGSLVMKMFRGEK